MGICSKPTRPDPGRGALSSCPSPNGPDPIPCGSGADAWREVAAEHVRCAGTDIYARNRAVSRAYADMYFRDPNTYRWAGMAAFASCTVGEGISQAEALRESGLPWIPGVSDISGTELSQSLQFGNALVYSDIYWQHLAYDHCGLGEMERAASAGKIPPSVLDAWRQIDRGRRTGDPTLVWAGNRALLRYEQETVLQDGVYSSNREVFRRLSQRTFVPPLPSPVPGGRNFQDVVPGGDIGNFAQRWTWIDSEMLPAWQRLADDPARVRTELGPCIN